MEREFLLAHFYFYVHVLIRSVHGVGAQEWSILLCPLAKTKRNTGLAAYAGYILGYWEVDRRNLMNVYHEGAIIFVLMIVCIVSSLVVYDWASFLVRKYMLKGNNATVGGASQVGSQKCS